MLFVQMFHLDIHEGELHSHADAFSFFQQLDFLLRVQKYLIACETHIKHLLTKLLTGFPAMCDI